VDTYALFRAGIGFLGRRLAQNKKGLRSSSDAWPAGLLYLPACQPIAHE
jgi:hypothetical protein